MAFHNHASDGFFRQSSSIMITAGPFPAVGPGPAISVNGTQVLGVGSAAFTPNFQFGQWQGDFINITGNIYTNAANPSGIIQSYGGGKIISGNTSTPTMGTGLIRASSTAGADWEDGHLGNSAELIFTPTDFVVGSSSTRSAQVQSSQLDPNIALSRWYGLTSGDGVVVAQKVIPKGFIIDGRETVIIYTPGTIGITNSTCYVSGQAVNISSTTILINLLSSTTFSTNSSTPLSGGGTLIGDGYNIITLYWDRRSAITTNAPSGAKITMRRI